MAGTGSVAKGRLGGSMAKVHIRYPRELSGGQRQRVVRRWIFTTGLPISLLQASSVLPR